MQSFQTTRIPLVFGIWAESQGIIVAIENPSDIIVASQRPYGSRAVLKFSCLDWTVQCTWGDLCGINVVRFWIMVWWLVFDEFWLWVVIDLDVHFGCGMAIPHSSNEESIKIASQMLSKTGTQWNSLDAAIHSPWLRSIHQRQSLGWTMDARFGVGLLSTSTCWFTCRHIEPLYIDLWFVTICTRNQCIFSILVNNMYIFMREGSSSHRVIVSGWHLQPSSLSSVQFAVEPTGLNSGSTWCNSTEL